MEENQQTGGCLRRELLSWGRVLLCSFVIALLITRFLVVNASVVSGSMEDTIMTGDRVMGNRLAYLGHDPARYDIVIFEYPDGDRINYVKRIIGLPGETVEIIDGKVYIDGGPEPLPDTFVREEPYGDYGPFLVPEGHYFLLGDNRNESYDSKNWQTHYVAREKIWGKLMFTYYPHISWVDSTTLEGTPAWADEARQ